MFQTKHEPKRGKGRFSTSVRSSPAKTINLMIFALPGPTTQTPKSSKELELAHAGLGRRLVTLTEDCKHADVCYFSLCMEFAMWRALIATVLIISCLAIRKTRWSTQNALLC